MPLKTREELSALASIRKLTVHDKLVSVGDDVTAVFFVFRGECTAKATRKQKGRREYEQRYGPGHVVGWCAILKNMIEGTVAGKEEGGNDVETCTAI